MRRSSANTLINGSAIPQENGKETVVYRAGQALYDKFGRRYTFKNCICCGKPSDNVCTNCIQLYCDAACHKKHYLTHNERCTKTEVLRNRYDYLTGVTTAFDDYDNHQPAVNSSALFNTGISRNHMPEISNASNPRNSGYISESGQRRDNSRIPGNSGDRGRNPSSLNRPEVSLSWKSDIPSWDPKYLSTSSFTQVAVGSVLSEHVLYIRMLEEHEFLRKICECICKGVNSWKVTPPVMNKPCCAYFENSWYRAVIIRELPIVVRYIDFGNEDSCISDHIKALPEELISIPPMAHKVVTNESCVTLEEDEQILVKRLRNVSNDGLYTVEIKRQHSNVKRGDNVVRMVQNLPNNIENNLPKSSTNRNQNKSFAQNSHRSSHSASKLVQDTPKIVSAMIETTLLRGVKDAAANVLSVAVDTNVPTIPECPFSVDSFTDVKITHKVTDDTFYVTLESDTDAINKLLIDLNKEAPSLANMTPLLNKWCSALFEECWFRAKVTCLDPVTVFFVDYGNEELCTLEQIKILPNKFLVQSPLAHKILISNKNEDLCIDQQIRIISRNMEVVNVDTYVVKIETPTSQIRNAEATKTSNTDEKKQVLNSVVNGEESVSNCPFQFDSYSEALITGKVDDTTFYVMSASDIQKLSQLRIKISQEIAKCTKLTPRLNQICLALFDSDWWRAKIINLSPLTVHFIDYGNDEVCSLDELRSLPEAYISQPPLVHRVKIINKWKDLQEAQFVDLKLKNKDHLVNGDTYLVEMKVPETQPHVIETVPENQPHDRGTRVQNQPHDGSTRVQNQPHNGSTSVQNQPHDGSTSVQNQPHDGSAHVQNQPHDVGTTAQNKPNDVLNSIVNGEESVSNCPFQFDSYSKAMITTKVDDDIFYVMEYSDIPKLEQLTSEINQATRNFTKLTPRLNQICLALFDSQWWRAKIINLSPLAVHYIDYGNDEVCSLEEIRSLPEEYISLPPLVHKVKIGNKCRDLQEEYVELKLKNKNRVNGDTYLVEMKVPEDQRHDVGTIPRNQSHDGITSVQNEPHDPLTVQYKPNDVGTTAKKQPHDVGTTAKKQPHDVGTTAKKQPHDVDTISKNQPHDLVNQPDVKSAQVSNKVNKVEKNIPAPPFQLILYTKVSVAYTISDTEYYVHTEKDVATDLTKDLNTINDLPPIKPELNTQCSALFDGIWWRAIIINTEPLTVKFLDYGNEMECSLEEIRQLPANFAEIPPLAHRIKIINNIQRPLNEQDEIEVILVDHQVQNEEDIWLVKMKTEDDTGEILEDQKFESSIEMIEPENEGKILFAKQLGERLFTVLPVFSNLRVHIESATKMIVDASANLRSPCIGDVVAVLEPNESDELNEPESWCRGRILRLSKEGEYILALIDQGQIYQYSAIKSLPEECKRIPDLSLLCEFEDLSFNVTVEDVSWCKITGAPSSKVRTGHILSTESRFSLYKWEPTVEEIGLSCVSLNSHALAHIIHSDNEYIYLIPASKEISDSFDKYTKSIFDHCEKELPLKRLRYFNEVLAAKSPIDGCYYRAQVKRKVGHLYECMFLDSGRTICLPISALKALPMDLKEVPCFAIKVTLKYVSLPLISDRARCHLDYVQEDKVNFTVWFFGDRESEVELYDSTGDSLNNKLKMME